MSLEAIQRIVIIVIMQHKKFGSHIKGYNSPVVTNRITNFAMMRHNMYGNRIKSYEEHV